MQTKPSRWISNGSLSVILMVSLNLLENLYNKGLKIKSSIAFSLLLVMMRESRGHKKCVLILVDFLFVHFWWVPSSMTRAHVCLQVISSWKYFLTKMTGECKSLDVTLNVSSNQEPCLILLSTLFALPTIPSKLSKSINPLFPKWVLRDTEV